MCFRRFRRVVHCVIDGDRGLDARGVLPSRVHPLRAASRLPYDGVPRVRDALLPYDGAQLLA
jgi:hypothetical protein